MDEIGGLGLSKEQEGDGRRRNLEGQVAGGEEKRRGTKKKMDFSI